MQRDGHTDRHDEAGSRFSQFCKLAYKSLRTVEIFRPLQSFRLLVVFKKCSWILSYDSIINRQFTVPYILKMYFTVIIPVTHSLPTVTFFQPCRVLYHNARKNGFC